MKYEYRYIILQDFGYPLISNCIGAGRILFRRRYFGTEMSPWSKSLSPWELDRLIFHSLPFQYQFELDVPAVQCTFMGTDAFSAPEAVWYKDISPGESVSIQMPAGWSGVLMLDANCVPPAPLKGQFELGNFLRSLPDLEGAQSLWISLRDEHGHQEKYKITTLIFTPQFLHSPLEFHEGRLYWQVTNNFFGGESSQFQIICSLPNEELQYEATTTDCLLNELFDFPDGRYPFQIFISGKKSVFASSTTNQLVYQGEITVGDPGHSPLNRKKSFWRCAVLDFGTDTLKTVFMAPGCGVIRDLVYQGKVLLLVNQWGPRLTQAPCILWITQELPSLQRKSIQQRV